jgi:hypothetical protein
MTIFLKQPAHQTEVLINAQTGEMKYCNELVRLSDLSGVRTPMPSRLLVVLGTVNECDAPAELRKPY